MREDYNVIDLETACNRTLQAYIFIQKQRNNTGFQPKHDYTARKKKYADDA